MTENEKTGTEKENFNLYYVQDSQKDGRKRSETFQETPVECINQVLALLYRVRHNYDNQGLMQRCKFNSLSVINLTWINLFINMYISDLKLAIYPSSIRKLTIDKLRL